MSTLFMLETFSDIGELVAAIDAIRSFSRLPIVANVTFSEEGTTFAGKHPKDAWEQLKDKDIQALGTNCTVGPQLLLPMVREFALHSSLPLSSDAQCGIPSTCRGPHGLSKVFAGILRIICSPRRPSWECVSWAAAVGPRRITFVPWPRRSKRFGRVPRGAPRATGGLASGSSKKRERARRIATREPESRLWSKIRVGQFVVSVEIDPPKGVTLNRILEQVGRVMASGKVDSIDVNSGTLARVGMDALVLAGELESHGFETIPHLTTRDANIIGLQAMLLGAWAVGGVRNILAITGDPPAVGDYPETTGVYELDSIGLVRVISHLNRGTDWAGKNLGGATNFTIGVAVNPVAEDLDQELRRFEAKVEAGAHFAMTQPIFDPEHWHQFLQRLGGKSPVPIIVGLWPLTSYKQALRLNNEVPGIVIPKAVLREMEKAGDSARECADLRWPGACWNGRGDQGPGSDQRSVFDSAVQAL